LLLHLNGTFGDSSPVTPHTCVSSGWSVGDILDESFANLTGWTDSDAGTGASTAVTYNSRSAAKLTNGASAGARHKKPYSDLELR